MAQIRLVSLRRTGISTRPTVLSAHWLRRNTVEAVSETPRIALRDLGSTDRAALRALITLFSAHGWRDGHGAALAILHEVSVNPLGISVSRVAAKVPQSFLDENRLTRKSLKAALENLSKT
jgi:hypothetical protein